MSEHRIVFRTCSRSDISHCYDINTIEEAVRYQVALLVPEAVVVAAVVPPAELPVAELPVGLQYLLHWQGLQNIPEYVRNR